MKIYQFFLSQKFLLIFFTLIILVYYLVGIITIENFPMVGVDEGWQWNNALLYSEPNFQSMNAPFFEVRHGFPYTMDFLLVLIGKEWGMGVFQGRMLILGISLITLIILFFLVRRMYGLPAAFLAIFFLISTDTFLSGSRVLRNDLLLGTYLLIWAHLFYSYLKSKKIIWLILSSVILAFSFDVHQNGFLFFLGSIFTLYLLPNATIKQKFQLLGIYLVGPIIFAIYYLFAHILPNQKSFLELNTYSYLIDHPLPILSLGPLELIFSELKRYYNHFWGPRVIEFVLIFASFLIILLKKTFKESFLALFLFSSSLMFFLFSPNKLEHYFTTFYLIYAIFAGYILFLLLKSLKQKFIASLDFKRNIKTYAFMLDFHFKSKLGLQKLLSFFVVSGLILFFSYNTYRIVIRIINFSSYDLTSLGNRINWVIPVESKVMGLPYWMLVLPNHDFVSSYTLTWYRVLKNKSLDESLSEISPNILILDKTLQNYLVDNPKLIGEKHFQKGLYYIDQNQLSAILNKRGKLTASFADKFLGPVEVYQLDFR